MNCETSLSKIILGAAPHQEYYNKMVNLWVETHNLFGGFSPHFSLVFSLVQSGAILHPKYCDLSQMTAIYLNPLRFDFAYFIGVSDDFAYIALSAKKEQVMGIEPTMPAL